MRFSEFLQENNGGFSLTRLVTFIVVIFFLFNWAWDMFNGRNFEPQWGTVTVLLTALGLKAAQKPFENASKDE